MRQAGVCHGEDSVAHGINIPRLRVLSKDFEAVRELDILLDCSAFLMR